MKNQTNEPGPPGDTNNDNLPQGGGNDKHLEGLSEGEKRMIRLMADIFVKSVLDS